MPSDDIAIRVRGLTKRYRLFGHPGDRVKQFLSLGLKRYHREFTALEDVSFEIRRGETVGIIGRNGSGKSTLLQLICGILKPTAGTAEVNGRVSALLELGAGFNPEFTGRENVYFHGALLGFTQAQMDERFDDIATFADIGEFIDQPVRTYSSGMFVRLAFATAISADPDILVVDEALAVGDARFHERCFEKIAAIRAKGGTILLVTHALEQIAHFCDRALLIDLGRLIEDDESSVTLTKYLAMLANEASRTSRCSHAVRLADATGLTSHPAYNPGENRWGNGAAAIHDVKIIQDGKTNPPAFAPGHEIELAMHVVFHEDVRRPIYGLTIKSSHGALVFNTNSKSDPDQSTQASRLGGDRVNVRFVFDPLLACGRYLLSLGVVSETGTGIIPLDRRYDVLVLHIDHPRQPSGEIAMNPRIRLESIA